jgi:hypothetical protein
MFNKKFFNQLHLFIFSNCNTPDCPNGTIDRFTTAIFGNISGNCPNITTSTEYYRDVTSIMNLLHAGKTKVN